MMRCEICGKSPSDGIALHRQNEKGVEGIWRCSDCNFKPVPPEIQLLLDALCGKRKPNERQ